MYTEQVTSKSFFPATMKKKDFVSKTEVIIKHLIEITGLEKLKVAKKVPTLMSSVAWKTPPSCTDLGLPVDELFEELPIAEAPEDPGSLKIKI